LWSTILKYYNEYRVHRSLAGATPAEKGGGPTQPLVRIARYRWQSHCQGLFELPSLLEPSNHEFATDTLKYELRARGALPLAECLSIAVSLAQGLEHLHGHRPWNGVQDTTRRMLRVSKRGHDAMNQRTTMLNHLMGRLATFDVVGKGDSPPF
jgi:hypothetical protein